MQKLLVICGPTSTGKTTQALKLAKRFNGEIISADSRQVYKGMDIGTGKDLPRGARIKYPWFSKFGYYEMDGVKVWGYDLVGPKKNFSIAQYLKFAGRIISDIGKRKALPILVGGTGLYIKGVIDGIPTATVPRNPSLRKNLEGRSSEELFEMIAQIDAVRAGQMNASDRKNPRRLIRAIEVATWSIDNSKRDSGKEKKKEYGVLIIGLTISKEKLSQRIGRRIKERVRLGVKKEIEGLLKNRVSWDSQSMTSLGYRQWRDFFEGKRAEDQIIAIWKTEEEKYSKRQMTWFKKDKRINWFDIEDKDYLKRVEKLAEKWYITSDAEKN